MIRFATMSSMARPDEDDVVLEEARVDVVGALAAGRLLDDHRDERARERRCLRSC